MNRKTLVFLSLIALVASFGPAAHAQTFSVIHTFTGTGGDGRVPVAGVTMRAGSFYGTTSGGGGYDDGEVYEMTPVGQGWFTSPIYTFEGGDGHNPLARVVFGPDGHPYGTTSLRGTVFDLIVPRTICKTVSCPWTENMLYQFQGGRDAGHGDLVWDQHGNIYGTTTIGGTKELGVVYELMPPVPPSNTWTESVIWNFTGPDGENPQGGVIFDSSSKLLGTAKQGGANGFGTVLKLTPSGSTWTETNVYDFQGGSDGEYPIAGLMIDNSGNIYGATSDGGSGGGGTVFELIPSGNSYTFKLLYSFSGQQGNNCGPWAPLSMDSSGSLYGTTYCGGANGDGSIFKLSNTQNGWEYTSLHDFTGGSDGEDPVSNVTFDANGNLFGTAEYGGTNDEGVVWMIKP